MAKDGTTRRDAERRPVSVADLLARHQGVGKVREPQAGELGRHHEPALVPTTRPSDTTDTGQMFVTDLLRREGREEEPPPPPARPSRMHSLVAVLACLALLFGAVIASAAALSGPRTERAAPSSPVPSSIAGAEAMRPDLIKAQVDFAPQPAPDTGDPAAAPPAQTLPSTTTPAQPAPAASRTVPGRDDLQPPRTAAPEPPTTLDEDPILDTVAAFYENVTATPQQAFGLLDPQLRGSGYLDFRKGWADVERVTVDDIRHDGPNAVLVTASLERSDGSVLRTVQRMLVTLGAQPRITDARLLSASRS